MAIEISAMTAPQAAAYALAVGLFPGLTPAIESLSSADLLVTGDTPFVVVPAQGADTIALPLFYIWDYVYGTVPYTTATSFKLCYGNISGPEITNLTDALLESSEDFLAALAGSFFDPPAGAVNQPIVLAANVNPTAGDGTATCSIYYVVLQR